MAERKGKKPWQWFFIGVIPFLGWIAGFWLALQPDKKSNETQSPAQEPKHDDNNNPIQDSLPQKLTGHSMPDGKKIKRKERDRDLEKKLKSILGENLKEQFGEFTSEGESQLIFDEIRILCKFSSYYNDQSKWFWGVSKKYWQSWEDYDYLAFILEDQSQQGYSFVILNSNEARILFKKCSQSGEEKKINMRVYSTDDALHFQEWKEFEVERRLKPLILKAAFNNVKKKPSSPGTEPNPAKEFLAKFASATAEEKMKIKKNLQDLLEKS